MTCVQREKRTKNLTRVGTFPVEEVLAFMGGKTKKIKIDFHGHKVSIGSVRLRTFLEQGVGCVVCGMRGEYFAVEKYIKDKGYHFNLYAVNRGADFFGSEVLMTKDHIIPKSKGGSNHISNMQPMCVECNYKKGTKID